MPNKLLSQNVNINGQQITGPLVGIDSLAGLINKVMNFLIPLAAIILLLVLILGGYDYMMSQGNPEKVKSAQAKLTTAIVGFILLLISYMLVRVIAFIFGLGGGII
jgi:TRAP-type C4-dicarboxylate transport system permease small subunit